MHEMTNIFTKEKTISSIEVAEMVEKQHNELLKDIRRYIEQLNEGEIPRVDFFAENTYIDAKGEKRPCYDVTKRVWDLTKGKLSIGAINGMLTRCSAKGYKNFRTPQYANSKNDVSRGLHKR